MRKYRAHCVGCSWESPLLPSERAVDRLAYGHELTGPSHYTSTHAEEVA